MPCWCLSGSFLAAGRLVGRSPRLSADPVMEAKVSKFNSPFRVSTKTLRVVPTQNA